MSYKVFDEDLREIVAGEYFPPRDRDRENLAKKKTISKRYGDFQFKETHLRNIYISSCEYDINNNVLLHGSTKEEMLCLTFMKQGSSLFSCSDIRNCYLPQNTFNLFYLNGDAKTETKLEKGYGNDVMDIVISKDYIMDMTEKYPEVFEHIYKKIEREQCFALHKDGVFTSSDMHQVIRQIKNADILGNTAPLYIEAKTQELFALLTCNTVNCVNEDVSCYLRDKMFEAKLVLEKNFNTPPSLNELARQIGVSVTTMKNCFKKVFDSTVYGYLFDYKMNKAESLLRNNKDLNISEIADLTGYEHQAHFCTAFKRKFGVTPSDYREKVCIFSV